MSDSEPQSSLHLGAPSRGVVHMALYRDDDEEEAAAAAAAAEIFVLAC